MNQIRKNPVMYCRLFGILLLIVGIGSALWGVFSREWLLLAPAVINLTAGVLYVRVKSEDFRRAAAMIPSHGGRPQPETTGVEQ